MTKPEALIILKLLSALESWSFAEKRTLPDYLLEDVAQSMGILEIEILK